MGSAVADVFTISSFAGVCLGDLEVEFMVLGPLQLLGFLKIRATPPYYYLCDFVAEADNTIR